MNDEDKDLKPADREVLPWIVGFFIVFMLGLMTLRSCYG